MKRLFKVKDDEFIHIMELLFGEVFLEVKHRFGLNMDVVTMLVVWGLELGDSIENVEWVVRAILDDEWLVGLNSILEWAIPGEGFDVSECFLDQQMVDLHELVHFMQWSTDFNRVKRRAEAVLAWDSLKNFLQQRMDAGGGALILVANVGGRNANGVHGPVWLRCGRVRGK